MANICCRYAARWGYHYAHPDRVVNHGVPFATDMAAPIRADHCAVTPIEFGLIMVSPASAPICRPDRATHAVTPTWRSESRCLRFYRYAAAHRATHIPRRQSAFDKPHDRGI